LVRALKADAKEGRGMCLIEVVEGPNAGHTYRFDRDELIVGRLTYCDIVINQKNVSRQHARLLTTAGDYFIEDLNSTNGTFLNGKRVLARTRLKDRDLIRVYNVTLAVSRNRCRSAVTMPSSENLPLRAVQHRTCRRLESSLEKQPRWGMVVTRGVGRVSS
jgi:pSer/pThr/pTyr-binding forkhead associated (FHA) protein